MMRFLALTVLIIVASTLSPVPVTAQESQSIEVANLFTWLTAAQPDWRKGIFLALLGMVGALVVVFSLVGGAIPGTAGSTRIDAGLKRVEEREKLLDDLLKAPGRTAEDIRAVEVAANNLRDDVAADRRQQFALAALLYTVLGAFFAAAIAQDILQALVVGAGWTSYLGALGLKRDYKERKAIKDDITDRLAESVERLAADSQRLAPTDRKEASEVLAEVPVSKAL